MGMAMESIANRYSASIDAFRQLLFALGADDCRAVHLRQIEAPELMDEFGRLQVWGDQSHANLPERARGSLDDILRHNDTLKRVVQGILDQLRNLLDTAVPIARKKFNPSIGSDQDSVSSVSADSESDSDSGEGPEERRRVPKITFIASQIHDQVQSLYRLSVALRRPAVSGRYIRSTRKTNQGSLEPFFGRYDYNHVCEKLLHWRSSSKASIATPTQEESPTTQEMITATNHHLTGQPNDTDILTKRLSEANTRRREQLQYWSKYPDQSNRPDSTQSSIDLSQIAKKTAGTRDDAKLESQSQGTTTKINKTSAEKSIKTAESFSAVAKSAIEAGNTEIGRPKTEYAQSQSAISSKQSNRVPEVPRVANTHNAFECPYCHQKLDSKTMKVRHSWKRHVFRDLRPYVCTLATCQNPDKLYATRHDWIYHEMQIHRRRWICGEECGQAYENRKAMGDHIRECHWDSVAEKQLSVMIDMCERPIDESELISCPLCSRAPLSLGRLHTHLAQHMEEIALFILSGSSEKDDDEDSLVSKRAARAASNDDHKASSSSSLGFSNSNEQPGWSQSSEAFRTHLNMDESKYMSTVEQWSRSVAEGSSISKKLPAVDASDDVYISVHNLSDEVDDELLFRAFSAFGSVTKAGLVEEKLHGWRLGRVAFRERGDAKKAIDSMNGALLGSRVIHCVRSPGGRCVRSPGGKLSTVQERDIKRQLGPISLKRFQVRDPHFFVRGTVFAALWFEPDDDKVYRDGEYAFSSIRLFVVVFQKDRYVLCVPITTYGGRGTTEKGIDRSAHAIIYTSEDPPNLLPGEEQLTKKPIRVSAVGQTLDPSSRVNFGKLYTIEYNNKVELFGYVEPSSLPYFQAYATEVLNEVDRNGPNIEGTSYINYHDPWGY